MVVPVDSTVVAMRKKVRKLTASASESSLSTDEIDRQLNAAMSQTFPNSIKQDLSRSVYTFFTRPYIDRYPLDVNFNQGVRAPVYIEGIQGSFSKDRQQFFALWPRFPTQFNPPLPPSGSITNITQANPAQVTSNSHGLVTGDTVIISGVVGMTEVNGGNYSITVIDANNFTLNGIDSTGFTPYVSGGTWQNQQITFTIPGPFLSKEVVIGGVDNSGTAISINDDGNGNLIYLLPNPVISVPSTFTNPAIPGMYNKNTASPGLLNPTQVGVVNYVTGTFSINFALAPGGNIVPALGSQMTLWVSQYQTGRPYSVLFWNNEFTIRPVPKLIHKIEVEVYLTPIQFLETTDQPILDAWWQYVSYIASQEILRERQDMEGVANLQEGLKKQEDIVLERQANEELFIPNVTAFNSVNAAMGGVNGIGYYI